MEEKYPGKMHKSERRLLTKIKIALEGKTKLLKKSCLNAEDQLQMNKFDYVLALVIDKAPKQAGLFNDIFEALINHFPEACNNIPPLEELRKRLDSSVAIKIEDAEQPIIKTEVMKSIEIENLPNDNLNVSEANDTNDEPLHLNESQFNLLVKLRKSLQTKDELIRKSSLSADEETQMRKCNYYIRRAREQSLKATTIFVENFETITSQYPYAYHSDSFPCEGQTIERCVPCSSGMTNPVIVKMESSCDNETPESNSNDKANEQLNNEKDSDRDALNMKSIVSDGNENSELSSEQLKNDHNSQNDQAENIASTSSNSTNSQGQISPKFRYFLEKFQTTLNDKKRLLEKSPLTLHQKNQLNQADRVISLVLRQFNKNSRYFYLQTLKEVIEENREICKSALEYCQVKTEEIEQLLGTNHVNEDRQNDENEGEIVENGNCSVNDVQQETMENDDNNASELNVSFNESLISNINSTSHAEDTNVTTNQSSENDKESEINGLTKDDPLYSHLHNSNKQIGREARRLLLRFHSALKKRTELMKRKNSKSYGKYQLKTNTIIKIATIHCEKDQTESYLQPFGLIVSQYAKAYKYWCDKFPEHAKRNGQQLKNKNSKNEKSIDNEVNPIAESNQSQQETEVAESSTNITKNSSQNITNEQRSSLNSLRYEFETKDKLMKKLNLTAEEQKQMEKNSYDINQIIQHSEMENGIHYMKLLKSLMVSYSITFKNERWYKELQEKIEEITLNRQKEKFTESNMVAKEGDPIDVATSTENKNSNSEENIKEQQNIQNEIDNVDGDDSVIFIPNQIEIITIEDASDVENVQSTAAANNCQNNPFTFKPFQGNKKCVRSVRRAMEEKRKLLKKATLTAEEQALINQHDFQIRIAFDFYRSATSNEHKKTFQDIQRQFPNGFKNIRSFAVLKSLLQSQTNGNNQDEKSFTSPQKQPTATHNRQQSNSNLNNRGNSYANRNNNNNNLNRKRSHDAAFQAPPSQPPPPPPPHVQPQINSMSTMWEITNRIAQEISNLVRPTQMPETSASTSSCQIAQTNFNPNPMRIQTDDCDLTIGIADENSPNGLTQSKWTIIEADMFQELIAYMEGNPDQPMPSFDDAGWSNNLKLIRCKDEFSLRWCGNILRRINNLWPGAMFKIINYNERNSFWPLAKVSLPQNVAPNVAFDLLKRQNRNIPTDDWKILKIIPGYGGDIFILQINKIAEDLLYPIHGRMSWGVRNVYLYLRKRHPNDGNFNTFESKEIERDLRDDGNHSSHFYNNS